MGSPGPQRLDQHRRSRDLHLRSARRRCRRRARRARAGSLPPAGPLDGRHRRPAAGARTPRARRVADPHGHAGRAGPRRCRASGSKTPSAMGREQGMGRSPTSWPASPMSSSVAPEEDRPRIAERNRHKLTNMDVEAFASLAEELRSFPSLLERLGDDHLPHHRARRRAGRCRSATRPTTSPRRSPAPSSSSSTERRTARRRSGARRGWRRCGSTSADRIRDTSDPLDASNLLDVLSSRCLPPSRRTSS